MTISWNIVIFKFRWIFATGEWRIVAEQTFHTVFCGSPLNRGNKRNTEQWASTGQCMDCLSRQNSSLIGPKNPAKLENYCISRSVHRLKITQPNLMILVSFSSAEDVLSNDVKNMKFLACKVLKICRSAFFGTRGIARGGGGGWGGGRGLSFVHILRPNLPRPGVQSGSYVIFRTCMLTEKLSNLWFCVQILYKLSIFNKFIWISLFLLLINEINLIWVIYAWKCVSDKFQKRKNNKKQ